ncbi:hypothetical protein DC366_16345 [Pelagivirga sediminicola]|uniref:Uncharacterized protein n=1 Tax=Pelagivirga sediminicola TaxID=2170575 RepID=A0A2T7G3K6_9RHOB|nr:hypothetical protein DC366_16345 [Pelagivirga sediminicola]
MDDGDLDRIDFALKLFQPIRVQFLPRFGTDGLVRIHPMFPFSRRPGPGRQVRAAFKSCDASGAIGSVPVPAR